MLSFFRTCDLMLNHSASRPTAEKVSPAQQQVLGDRELLDEILDHLDCAEKAQAASVCKTWKAAMPQVFLDAAQRVNKGFPGAPKNLPKTQHVPVLQRIPSEPPPTGCWRTTKLPSPTNTDRSPHSTRAYREVFFSLNSENEWLIESKCLASSHLRGSSNSISQLAVLDEENNLQLFNPSFGKRTHLPAQKIFVPPTTQWSSDPTVHLSRQGDLICEQDSSKFFVWQLSSGELLWPASATGRRSP